MSDGFEEWLPADQAPSGEQLLLWEPMYGVLVGTWNSFDCGKWQIKSTGNYYFEAPEELRISHFARLPAGPRSEERAA